MSTNIHAWRIYDRDSWGRRIVYKKHYDANKYVFMTIRADYKPSPIKNKTYHWVHIGYRIYVFDRYKGRKLYNTLRDAKLAADKLAQAIFDT